MIFKRKPFRTLLFPRAGLALLSLLCVATSALAQEPAAEPATPAATAAAEPPPSPSTDVSGRSQQALRRISAISEELTSLALSEDDATWLERNNAELDDDFGSPAALDSRMATMSDAQLDDMDGAFSERRSKVRSRSKILDELALELELILQELKSISQSWQTTRDDNKGELPAALADRIGSLLTQAQAATNTAEGHLNAVAEAQNGMLLLRERLERMRQKVENHKAGLRGALFQFQQTPMWMMDLASVRETYGQTASDFRARWGQDVTSFVDQNGPLLFMHVLAGILVLFGIRMLRLGAERSGVDPAETRILQRPVSSGLLITVLFEGFFYPTAPSTIIVTFGIAAAVLAVIVLRPFLARDLRRVLIALVVLYIIERILAMAAGGAPLHRMILLGLGVAIAVLISVAGQRKFTEVMHERGLSRLIIKPTFVVAMVFSLVAVVLNILGNVALSVLLISGTIRSLLALLMVFTIYLIVNDLFSLLLRPGFVTRFRSISRNRERLGIAARKPVLVVAVVGWAMLVLSFFGLLKPTLDGVSGVLSAEASLGNLTLSMGRFVAFVLAIWIAVVASRITRAILADDVLPRFPLPRGVPNTIGVTVNYAIVLVGLLIGTAFLGIDLSNLSLILGALGVGIGFGLQSVVNNFVSGLILIFERPIQIGDVVEVGTLFGRVTQIGLRASRVRTFSGSEIIVPNGDLVSQQVTNWTLSDRRRRLEIPVGVAYSSNPEEVTRVLSEIIAGDEAVLEDPEPMVIFEEFGDSALQFRIYCWIADFDESFGARSRLHTNIHQALAAAGIEIPFPQRDLHLRSIQTTDELRLGGSAAAEVPARP